jgi:hypothetical protein
MGRSLDFIGFSVGSVCLILGVGLAVLCSLRHQVGSGKEIFRLSSSRSLKAQAADRLPMWPLTALPRKVLVANVGTQRFFKCLLSLTGYW